jgi:hypothetical protein
MSTNPVDEIELDNIFDMISAKRSSRDAQARNCVEALLAKDTGLALRFAEMSRETQREYEELLQRMKKMYPDPEKDA